MRLEYLRNFVKIFEYPEEACISLEKDYQKIYGNTEANELFEKFIKMYENNELEDHGNALENMNKVAELSGVHTYTVQFLMYLFFSEHLRVLYEEKGIEEEIYYDSMYDLKCKLIECYKMHDIWGAFVAWWFDGFFTLSRFALGRLQFELNHLGIDYVKKGIDTEYYNVTSSEISFGKKDTVINMHIPSRGDLAHEKCIDSYKKAYKFYDKYQKDGVLGFVCHSWLLYAKHKEFLPQNSNIVKFISDFDIYNSHESDSFGDAWRVYYKDAKKPVDELPTDTSLRRAYTEWLRAGNKAGGGDGFFMFDGEKVIK